MAKMKKTTLVVKCECSVCGQVAHVEENTVHYHCRGIKLVKPLPGMFMQLCKPDNKGTWKRWVAPVVHTDADAISLAMSGGEEPLLPSVLDPSQVS